ncbi:MAG: hypothetical protein IKT67_03575 [Lachnospiraceae bacterium]|nr:hypothetical protein [Lachnospiraceae bacterium]
MSKKKLTNKQKKLYGTLLVIAVIVVLALIKGKDLKQVFNSLFPDGISAEQTLDTEDIGNTLTEVLSGDKLTATPSLKDSEGETVTPTAAPDPTLTPEPTATVAPTSTPEPTATAAPTNTPDPTATPEPASTPTPEPTKSPLELVEEDGVYSTPDLVAAYIYTFHKLPSNFITKNEASKLGWVSNKGNLWDVTDEMSIGGDKFGNYEGLLPKAKGRQWYECDVNYYGGYRGSERILYSNDGLIYYTDDHYESFTQLY